MTETITVVRPPGVDSRSGDPLPGEPERFPIEGCLVEPHLAPARTLDEPRGRGRDTILTSMTVYAPPGADILATDQAEVRGKLYGVEGEPGEWRSRHTGLPVGVQVSLRRATG